MKETKLENRLTEIEVTMKHQTKTLDKLVKLMSCMAKFEQHMVDLDKRVSSIETKNGRIFTGLITTVFAAVVGLIISQVN